MCSRGSVWRKWDLHVHTPESIENNYKSKNGMSVWDSYISDLEALPVDIKVIGINDYLFLDGYKKVLEYRKQGRLANIDLILPVIEFRLARFCGTKQFKRINFHLIFSNEISPNIIENQFLNTLSSAYKLDPDSQQITWDGYITKDNLTQLGRNILNTIPLERKHEYGSPLKEGFNNLNIEITSIQNALKNASSYFKGKYLTAIGKTEWDELKWDDSSIAEKKTIINNVDFIFTASESIEKFNRGKEKLKENGVNALLLDCSDSHNNIDCTDSKDRLGNCFTWIKADPTFEGLKQVIVEPTERIFVGKRPEIINNVENNRTKYINKVFVSSIEGYGGGQGKWFENVEIPFNKELVAIIGNKGNGKSAIADILAHCCNVQKQEYFSFLHHTKFRKGGLANNFHATTIFEDGSEFNKDNLGELKDRSNAESLVKYLPQGYFESICNDLQKEDDFKKEIENVVFQYVDPVEKLGTPNFSELINKKSELVETEIRELKVKLSSINQSIIALEHKENIKYKEWIESEINKKKTEVNALLQPIIIEKPDASSPEAQKTLNEITTLKEAIEKLTLDIETKKQEKQKLAERIIAINSLIDKMNGLERKIEDFKNENKTEIEELGLDVENIIKVIFDFSSINTLLSITKKEYQKIDDTFLIDSEVSKSLLSQKADLEKQVEDKQRLLQGPELEYQQYLRKKEEYEQQKNNIEGKENIPNTLKWFEHEKQYIEYDLTSHIDKKYEERRDIVKKIYAKKQQIIDIYKTVKNKIDEKIEENNDLLGPYNIRIEASLSVDHKFNEEFLHYIKQNVKGSFKGKFEGDALVREVKMNSDVQNVDGLLSFCERFIQLLKYDKGKQNERRYTEEQIDNMQGLYDYLFSLDYLQYNYKLKQHEKELSLLSPGEKGALLLVFYLLLDMDNKPLILDQPEDNLDNDSVANILVNFIKRAKKKRQILMVTHNPNLAIVADAEQIIYVHIDKKDNYKFSVEAGSIENPVINKHIVDVLEGAMPAFRKRDNKYIRNSR